MTATDLPAEGVEAHGPGDDWTCLCGFDYFGGSAGYSWQLYEAHLPRDHCEACPFVACEGCKYQSPEGDE